MGKMGVSYIGFLKSTLPFRMLKRQIIYVEDSYHPEINQFIEKNYGKIAKLFDEKGYDFAYIPVIQKNILDENDASIRYYYPDTSPDFKNSFKNPVPQDIYNTLFSFLKYEKEPLRSGFICYELTIFNTTVFSYFQIRFKSENDLWKQMKWYIQNIDLPFSKRNIEKCLDLITKDESYSLEQIRYKEDDIHYESEYSTEPIWHTSGGYWTDDTSYPTLPCAPYRPSREEYADFVFPEEGRQFLSEAKAAVNKLKQLGVRELIIKMHLFSQTQELSELLITEKFEIILTDYTNEEGNIMKIDLDPLPKAVYLLFLKYQEGILFKHLSDYKEELMNIYEKLSNRKKNSQIRKDSIDKLVDSTTNSINENCSRIREAFIKEFDESLAENYFITGERSMPKRIKLDRSLVYWEIDL
ncbi:MAG: hypothetical protein LBI15_02985 [Dysgonamonadaceae bacterium]|jgi:hypothetical protein|nr:hypothetical protein [Dysgonamonadaceae bacterium]